LGFFLFFYCPVLAWQSSVALPMEEQAPHQVSNRNPGKPRQKVGEAQGNSAVRTGQPLNTFASYLTGIRSSLEGLEQPQDHVEQRFIALFSFRDFFSLQNFGLCSKIDKSWLYLSDGY
jgi:hypothetical protein